MSKVETVLICIDSSDKSDLAFQWYLDNLHRPENQVLLFHSFMPLKTSLSGSVFRKKFSNSYKEYQEVVEVELKKVAAMVIKYENILKELQVAGTVVSKQPSNSIGEEILKEAEANKVIMIVMGTRGLGYIKKKFLGSVSTYVLHHSHFPVVICNG